MSNTPVIAIVGRPNVGKSTLFNQLTRSRNSLVADIPGVTRDRIYGDGKLSYKPYIVIDTGGLMGEETGIDAAMAEQTMLAVNEADILFLLVDARAGVIAGDIELASKLRQTNKQIKLLVNKTDGLNEETACIDFYQLGLGDPIPIAASHNRGVRQCIEQVLAEFGVDEVDNLLEEENRGICVAIVGRPNVGKSTLINRMLGENRVVVFDKPGTTRDSISIEMERDGEVYTLVDTAGVRRKSKVVEIIEKFSAIKTLRSINKAHVVVVLLDGTEGVADQDLNLIDYILHAGKAMVLAINKWDGLSDYQRKNVKADLERRLSFLPFVNQKFISALHGTGVGNLFTDIKAAYKSAMKKLTTSELTKILEQAVTAHAPPLVKGRRIKLRYAHAGGHNPPRIIIHGNQVASISESYTRYLANCFQKAFKLTGTPVFIEFKSGENPFAGKRNILTERQKNKRKRLKKFIQKRSK